MQKGELLFHLSLAFSVGTIFYVTAFGAHWFGPH
jgi:hypothetical protein